MKAVATKVISFLACAFVALQAFGFYATYCAWGCNWDWILSAAVAIFSVAVLGAHYFLVRIGLVLFYNLRSNKPDSETERNGL